MTDKELKEKIADFVMDAIEEYNDNEINRPMIAGLCANKILSIINSLPEEPVCEYLHTTAKEYANNITDKIGLRIQLRRAVIYGAKWQASQGVTKEAVIGMATEEISINVSQSTLDALDLCAGDKVIIQIRKKEK